VKYRKISWDEVIKILGITYQIKDIKLMHHQSYEGDIECYESIDYIIGEETTQ